MASKELVRNCRPWPSTVASRRRSAHVQQSTGLGVFSASHKASHAGRLQPAGESVDTYATPGAAARDKLVLAEWALAKALAFFLGSFLPITAELLGAFNAISGSRRGKFSPPDWLRVAARHRASLPCRSWPISSAISRTVRPGWRRWRRCRRLHWRSLPGAGKPEPERHASLPSIGIRPIDGCLWMGSRMNWSELWLDITLWEGRSRCDSGGDTATLRHRDYVPMEVTRMPCQGYAPVTPENRQGRSAGTRYVPASRVKSVSDIRRPSRRIS